ncbi:hypothetical protein L3X38_000258 (mitochondrion) [Prunus dulcis]|uniref:Uncharacterized protein n=1 Tax=Prunus dulcis TaxID=3755 RepID=A0AAD4UTA6_PRUDU|nr:hypothetical protein L3X38_000258 [Prunus dulcis]
MTPIRSIIPRGIENRRKRNGKECLSILKTDTLVTAHPSDEIQEKQACSTRKIKLLNPTRSTKNPRILEQLNKQAERAPLWTHRSLPLTLVRCLNLPQDKYAVFGNDAFLCDDLVAAKYLEETLSELEVKISHQKSRVYSLYKGAG